MHTCLKCGVQVGKRFRLVLGNGRMERLCLACSDQLSTLVRMAGDTCQLSVTDHRFVTWLETGHWPMQDGRTIELGAAPGNRPVVGGEVRHGSECPCCATFAEDQD